MLFSVVKIVCSFLLHICKRHIHKIRKFLFRQLCQRRQNIMHPYMDEIQTAKLSSNYDPYILKETRADFLRRLSLIYLRGEASLFNGQITGLKNLRLMSRSLLRKKDGGIRMNLKFEASQLSLHYDVSVKFLNIGSTFAFNASLQSVILEADFKITPGKSFSLNSFFIFDLKGEKICVSELKQFDWIINLVISIWLKFFSTFMVYLFEFNFEIHVNKKFSDTESALFQIIRKSANFTHCKNSKPRNLPTNLSDSDEVLKRVKCKENVLVKSRNVCRFQSVILIDELFQKLKSFSNFQWMCNRESISPDSNSGNYESANAEYSTDYISCTSDDSTKFEESNSDSDTESDSDTDTESSTESDTESSTESDSDTESTESDTKSSDTESDTDTESDSDIDTESDSDTDTESDSDTESDLCSSEDDVEVISSNSESVSESDKSHISEVTDLDDTRSSKDVDELEDTFGSENCAGLNSSLSSEEGENDSNESGNIGDLISALLKIVLDESCESEDGDTNNESASTAFV